MTDDNDPGRGEPELVVPVLSEEAHADAVPVETGGVRVVKHVEGHEEILEQELRKGRAEVKRVKTNRVVDGPQAAQRAGDTLIIPVVSEVLRVTKEWVVTEEIHITQFEERETVQERVRLNQEVADVQRFDETGRVTRDVVEETKAWPANVEPTTAQPARATAATAPDGGPRRLLSDRPSLLRDRGNR